MVPLQGHWVRTCKAELSSSSFPLGPGGRHRERLVFPRNMQRATGATLSDWDVTPGSGWQSVNRVGLMDRSVCPQIFHDCLQCCKGVTPHGVWALKPLSWLIMDWEGTEGFQRILSRDSQWTDASGLQLPLGFWEVGGGMSGAEISWCEQWPPLSYSCMPQSTWEAAWLHSADSRSTASHVESGGSRGSMLGW